MYIMHILLNSLSKQVVGKLGVIYLILGLATT